MSPFRRPSIVALMFLFAFVLADGRRAAAQTTATSGIEGRITDTTGAVLPGVTATISSPAMQVPEMTTVSDENGRYRFASIPGGVYKLTFALTGFATVIREDLTVGIGTVVTIDPKMSLGALEEAITVKGDSPVVDVRTTTATTNLSKTLISDLPTSRGVGELIKLAPGTRGSANYGVAGTISHTYDGVQARDTFRYPDVGSLEEVQVRAVGNDAETAVAGVSFIAAIKSGGNTFHGSYVAQWEGEKFAGDNIDDRLRAQGLTAGNPRLLYNDFSADIGGRVVKDRLWFYVAARREATKDKIIGYRGDPGSDGLFFTTDDVQGNSDQTMTVRPTSKATGQLTSKQKVNFLYVWEQQRSLARSADSFHTGTSVGNYFLPNDLKKVEWTYNPTSRSILNIFVGDTQWNSLSLPYTTEPPSFDNVTRRVTGAYVNSVGSDSTPAGSNSERWIYNATYSYFRSGFGGDHDIKAGFEATREWYNKFQRARDADTGGVGHDYRLYYDNGTPFEVLLYNSPFNSLNNLNNQSYFVRDNWLMNDRFTLSLGFRMEHYDAFLPKQSKPAGPYSPAAEYAALDVYNWWNPAPRVAISYALTSDKRTVVKATWGRFNAVNNAQEGRTFNQNDYFAWRYKWTDLNNNRALDYPSEIGALVSTESAQGAGLKILNTDLKQPKEDEITAHLERELSRGLSVRTGYVYKKLFDQYEEINPGRPFSAYNIPIAGIDPGPDGVRGTADDGGAFTYYDYDPAFRGAQFDQSERFNTPGLVDRYHNFELTATKRMSDRWQILTSLLATHGNIWRNTATPQTPNNFYPKTQYWESSFKLSGTYLMPYRIQVASYYQYLSGAYWGRTARFTTGLRQLSSLTLDMESPTANRRPGQNTVDIRFERSDKIGMGSLRWGIEFYNTFNANFTTNTSVISGPTFGQITAIQSARRARLVANYQF